MSARRERVPGMTVDEFVAWYPDDRRMRWQLIDGVPTAMAPPAENHARLHAELAFAITAHLRASRPACAALVGAGVVPFVEADSNFRIPDLVVTCAPSAGARDAPAPRVVLEILSPPTAHITRQNVWAYATIPSVLEIVLLESTRVAAHVYTRAGDGSWPRTPETVGEADVLESRSLAFAVPLRDLYRTTGLLTPR